VHDAVEFLKFTQTLFKGDDALLVCLLERYAAHTKPQRVQAFYAEELGVPHVDFPKNLLRIATGYSELQRLRGHSFNIFEFAFLGVKPLQDKDGRTRAIGYLVTALFTFLLQFLVFSSLCYFSIGPDYNSFLERYGEITAYREGAAPIVCIAFGTTILFCKRAYMQFCEASDFNQVFWKLQLREGAGVRKILDPWTIFYKKWCLRLNFAVNCVLAALIPAFNLYYLLLSDSVDDAVKDSLALLFVLELDEVVLPSWDEHRIEDELATNLLMYIGKKPKRDDEVIVIKVRARVLSHVTCALLNEPHTPRP
jgi:hypothetical protein